VKRSQLAHILRAASDVTDDPRILVIGSQAILASFPEEDLPADVTLSIEADVAFLDDPDGSKSDKVDGAIGEQSRFHETFGIYGQGVGVDTAVLPAGWEERLVAFDDPEAGAIKAFCLDAHDLVVSKLVAGREKDFRFASALIAARLIDPAILSARTELLEGSPAVRRRVGKWISGAVAS
jgi:hypothetical protein